MNIEFNLNELKAADRLPSPSGTALAIMQLVQQSDATVQQVSQLVKVDPALSGRILRFANSAAFGARRPIADIQTAVMMMGMQTVRNFALSLSLIGSNSKGHCPEFDYEAYWSRSLAMSVSIAAITAREVTVVPAESFTLGLLSDIGGLALATAWSEIYGECLGMAEGKQLLALERERFAIDHNALSLMLLADWGFPTVFLDALKLSFEMKVAGLTRIDQFARQLILARLIGNYCVADEAHRAMLLPYLTAEADLHALDEPALLAFIDETIELWHEWGKLIDVKTDVRQPLKAVDTSESDLLGLNLLLVDDDLMMLARLSKQLAAAGNQVAVCRNGESALKYVIEHKPQLVITDWRMKPMDGLALCKALRASVFGKNIYLIMLTSTEDEDALVEAFDAGIDDYVTKPISLRVLLARLRAGQRIITLQNELEKESRDIQRYTAELAAANRRLKSMANTDVLTGLPNRRYALNRLEQEAATALRSNQPLSVLMLDLDYFKSVNDTLGHDVGDQVLIHAANLMRTTARTNDITCRLGGEEFLIIAPNTDGSTALLLAERIRNSIERNQPKGLALRYPVTVSIGVAGAMGAKPSWKELMKRADDALYLVKQGNRNGVRLES
ncbi:diguanylate cyclase [Methylobacter sp.]|uniref:GGDEF domain-containing response regulator n=1 Tax=Methylobacter sp. TaxID=2051955 RepID=UPI00248A12A0|nr:diguanylate cyclase [Methylobacter sp.]MDI1279003.1 diguanylate cyclase [Methylobacter sp.]MDI1359813.1 diguanylate cyclase [Methylobacter sp.]